MAKTLSLPNATLPENLDALAAVILGALPKPTDDQRDGLSAGTHQANLDIHLRVRGELAVGVSGTTLQINKLKPWTLAKLLANRVPADVLRECIDQALAAAKGSELAAEAMEAEADDLKTRVEAVFEQAGLAVLGKRRGSVKLKGEVEVKVVEH